MKKILVIIIVLVMLSFYFFITNKNSTCYSQSLSGSVKEDDYFSKSTKNTIVDDLTGQPVSNAQISIPSKGINAVSNSNGSFALNAELDGPTILSITASGYKPFSVTIDQNSLDKPLVLGLSKSGKEIVIDSRLHHLGDDNFSTESANSGDFQAKAEGPSFSKDFHISAISSKANYSLKIGSIIGLDTQIARRLGQSHSASSSSPAKIYLNDKKIGEIKINGDNEDISIPNEFLNPNSTNQITIITGKNTHPHTYIDYDDMEFMNLILEIR